MKKTLIAITLTLAASTSFAQVHVVQKESMEQVQLFSESLGKVYKTQGEEKAIEVGSEAVRSTLKDPNSAMFRNLKVKPYLQGYVLCGEVNAKNSYGGYVGFKPFAAGAHSSVMWYKGPVGYINDAANIGIVSACFSQSEVQSNA